MQQVSRSRKMHSHGSQGELFVASSYNNFIETYQNQLADLANKLNSFGLQVVAFNSKSWQQFEKMSPEQRQSSYSRFLFYYEICQECLVDGNSLTDNNKLLWYAIKKMNLRPKSDLFDKLAHDDVVEIYDASFMQVYRNFNFFEICSYSLADLFMWEWRDLYYRDDVITQGLAQQGIKVFTNEAETQKILVPEHKLKELFSEQKFVMHMKPGLFSPLFDKLKCVPAVVATSKVNILYSAKEKDSLFDLNLSESLI